MALAGMKGMSKSKRKTIRTPKSLDMLYMGQEPTFTPNVEITDQVLGKAYTWYNHFHDYKDAKKFTLEYLKEQKTGKKILVALEDFEKDNFNTIGWQCRMLSRGAVLPIRSMTYLKERLTPLIQKAIQKTAEQSAMKAIVAIPKVSVQDYLAAQLSSYIAELDSEIDKFVDGGYKETEFKPYEWLKSKNVKGALAKKIREYFVPLVNELQSALDKDEEDVVVAYKPLKKKQLKAYHTLIFQIVSDAGQVAVNAKAMRKPRMKKIKTASQLAAKLKYKATDDKLKLTSIQPIEIVGATQLWVYNTVKRKLGVYIGDTGLSVKGTTILGFNETTSIQKKVRKPDVVLPLVTQGGRVALRTVMSDIKAKASPLTGRLNSDTILLKVIK